MLRPQVIASIRSQVSQQTVRRFPLVDNLTPEEVYYIQSLGKDISFLSSVCSLIQKNQGYLDQLRSTTTFYEHSAFFAWFGSSSPYLPSIQLHLFLKEDSVRRDYRALIRNPESKPFEVSLTSYSSSPSLTLSLEDRKIFPSSEFLSAIPVVCALEKPPLDVGFLISKDPDCLPPLSTYVYEQAFV